MKSEKNISCCSCFKDSLSKEEIGATKKLSGMDTKQFYCLDCLAAYLEVSVEEIEDKIQMFKEDGCTLFN